MRVKICGTTSDEDARLAVSLGADALGFLVGLNYPADDEISADTARSIIRKQPPFISSVLVTHKNDPSWIVETAQVIGCNTLQLHGDVPLKELEGIRSRLPYLKIIKTIHVQSDEAVMAALEAEKVADAILLDTITDERLGGTGKTHDWSISRKIVEALNAPVILAGGLTPENVREAITYVRPFGVDVNSGVEHPNGKKSPARVRDFILRVHEAIRELTGR